MTVVVVGVRHHSPACARVVLNTITRLRPTHVLIEGPSDFTDALTDLGRDHVLPIALFTHVRRGSSTRMSWTAFTEWSPEWVALRSATDIGAEIRFIDLPSWHPAFDSGAPDHGPIAAELSRRLGVDTVDATWDHVVESHANTVPVAEMTVLLQEYFDTLRADDVTVTERERAMASWICAARDRPDSGTVVVICGGLHRPALLSAIDMTPVSDGSWPTPEVPHPDLDVGTYLVPYSYERLTSPSPWWYENLWRSPTTAVDAVARAVVLDLRAGGHRVSSTDFIGFRTQLLGLAALRGHSVPTRLDILDAAASTLVDEALPTPLPWTRPAVSPSAATHPVIASVIATLRGARVGRLHPDTPVPGLVPHVDLLLDELDLVAGTVDLDLTDRRDLRRSRTLHQLRILAVPGFTRLSGPLGGGSDISPTERWTIVPSEERIPALTHAAAHGHTLVDAAGVALDASLASAASDVATLSSILYDAILSGLEVMTARSAATATHTLATITDLADAGSLLRTSLDLWRHDSLFETDGSTVLGAVVGASAERVVTLARRVRADSSGADLPRVAAVAALSDTMIHAPALLTTDPSGEMALLAGDSAAAVDIRGAALGTVWDAVSTGRAEMIARSISSNQLGDWLCGLFTVARERFLDSGSSTVLLDTVDDVVSALTEHEFLRALPALRQSFEFFPPRERDAIAARFAEPEPNTAGHIPDELAAEGRRLDDRVHDALHELGLS